VAGKLHVEYSGTEIHVLNSGKRPEPMSPSDQDRALFLDRPAKTMMNWCGLAKRLNMGAASSLAYLLPGARRKQLYAIMWD
jgi:hypothetical protein